MKPTETDCHHGIKDPASRPWPELLPLLFREESRLTHGELLDRLEQLGVSEGYLDGMVEELEKQPGIQTDEDILFTYHQRRLAECWIDAASVPPPQDGTLIVAMGAVLYHDDEGGSSTPFVAEITWTRCESGYEGWQLDDGLALARCPGESVVIHHWLLPPSAA